MAFVGLIIYPPGYNEYIGTFLTDALVGGMKYYVTFYVSHEPNFVQGFPDTTDAISALLTIGPPDTTGSMYSPTFQGLIQLAAQVSNADGVFLIDTLNWMKISGSFIAAGGENFITIGNFKDTSLSHGSQCYYYIEDVCISRDSLECELNTSTNHQPVQSKLSIYPTIAHQAVNFTFPQGSTHFNIFNAIGQSVYNSNATSLHQAVDVSHFSEGIYFVRVQTYQGIQTAKFVVQR